MRELPKGRPGVTADGKKVRYLTPEEYKEFKKVMALRVIKLICAIGFVIGSHFVLKQIFNPSYQAPVYIPQTNY